MPQLLLELLSEEIPARMQARASQDLLRLVSDGLIAGGLEIGKGQAFATPRRLTVIIDDVPEKSPAVSDERKGPRVGAPDKAIQGFLRGAGLKSIDDAEVVSDPKKGDFYVARINKPGRPAPDIIAEVIPEAAGKFPWPKSMRWGDGDFQWVRPLHSVLCLLGSQVVPFEIAGIKSGNQTTGHRFHGRETIAVESFEDYGRKLLDAKVLLPASERAAAIAEEARQLADDAGLELVEDEALMLENAGLTEWPTALMGTFDEEFLEVPAECLITSMKSHQKCFSLRDPKTGKLTNRFILVSNLIADDGGKQIIAGNEKVIRARLADAKFFWDQDLKRTLDEMESDLEDITFHAKLGTQKDRVERVAELAYQIAGAVDADPDSARRAAQLCKADLVSEMVGEFPELQGLMGRYYAEKGGIAPDIARAIELHYKPKGASDTVPLEEEGNHTAIAVALADKLDTLVGFWAIDEKPTGSGDPYQLRRAALGVIRILLENDLRLSLLKKIGLALCPLSPVGKVDQEGNVKNPLSPGGEGRGEGGRNVREGEKNVGQGGAKSVNADAVTTNLLSFFADRLKVHLRDQGKRHDLIDAVFALPGQDDIALIVKRVEALSDFLETDDGANLLAGVKRATNILAIEEKKDKRTYDGEPSGPLMTEPAERALAAAIAKVKFDTRAAINVESFAGAMSALAELRAPVDKFFDDVTVNADDKALRENRLRLLAEIRAATLTVADFSRIAG
ncbi:MAG: glycine--tRNA ligase subunit beta [Alphaproteobacteria bacterium]|nr:glycine--tRNA ligase subunit beta [Alphaproteobacteria bacterium]